MTVILVLIVFEGPLDHRSHIPDIYLYDSSTTTAAAAAVLVIVSLLHHCSR